MRIVIQRVSHAKVKVNNEVVGAIQKGLLILVGIEDADSEEDIIWLTQKATQLRIFNDANDVMNLSVQDVGGDILAISQFTLHASTKKGNRPSYIKASKPTIAEPLYNLFVTHLQKLMNKPIATGIFGADMKVELLNDGPVTIVIDSKQKE